MSKFRKKAVEVEAVQWTGENGEEITALAGPGHGWAVETARPGDYVLRLGAGAVVAVAQGRFEATYEPVDPQHSSGQDWMQTSLATVLRHFESEANAADELADNEDGDTPLRRRYYTERDTYRYVLKQIREAQPEPQHPQVGEERDEQRSPKLWRCPKHGLIEPYRHAYEWGSGEPGEYGACPIMEDEDTSCSRAMFPVPEPPHPAEGEGREAELREALQRIADLTVEQGDSIESAITATEIAIAALDGGDGE